MKSCQFDMKVRHVILQRNTGEIGELAQLLRKLSALAKVQSLIPRGGSGLPVTSVLEE